MSLRKKLKNIHALRSTYYFFYSLRERWQWQHKPVLDNWLNEMYEKEDPWNYTTSQGELDRFQSAVELLDVARERGRFERAFEVGCAEGVFTRMLADRCENLLAVDIAPAALKRARSRCPEGNINFNHWDLTASPAPANMDLVVIMDVLELFFKPRDIQSAREKLISALRPGGYLLLGNSKQNDIFESSWWGKWMLRGGKRIAEYFGEHPQLDLVISESRGIYVNAVFRRKLEA